MFFKDSPLLCADKSSCASVCSLFISSIGSEGTVDLTFCARPNPVVSSQL